MIQTRTTPRAKANWTTTEAGQAQMRREELAAKTRLEEKRAATRQRWIKNAQARQRKPKTPISRLPSKPLRQVSKSKARVTRLYIFARGFFLSRNLKCAGDSTKSATDVHHFQGRAGTLYLDWRFWMAVSRDIHNWIGDNIEAAQERGLLAPKGFWHNAPADERTRQLKEIIQCAQTDYPEARRLLIVLMQSDGLVPDTSAPPK